MLMSLFRSGSLTAAARESERNKSDLVGVKEVTWDKRGTVRAGIYSFFYGQGNGNHPIETKLLYTTE